MLIVGLTGNYGMGKTTVLRMFRELGAVTISADEIVHKLLEEREVLKNIRDVLGDSVFIPDGKLDKEKTASVIFSDKQARDALENMLHPLVFNEIDKFINARGKDSDDILIIEVPLIFEKECAARFDKTVTVFAHESVALQRLEALGIKPDHAGMRLKAQMPVEEKMRRADFVIDNSRTLNETREQVEDIYRRLAEESVLWKL